MDFLNDHFMNGVIVGFALGAFWFGIIAPVCKNKKDG